MLARPRSHSTSPARGVLYTTLVLALALPACDETHTDFTERFGNDPVLTGLVPPVPMDVEGEVGDLMVTLTWSVDDATGVAGYRVFRRQAGGAETVRAELVPDPTYVDRSVQNNVSYTYRVSSVLTNGLVGERSAEVTVVPAVYAVLLQGGAPYATGRTLTVNLTAPATTTAMRIGETADLSAEPWRPYATQTGHTLTVGEGDRTLYAQFRDETGNPTSVVSDGIILDSRAEITAMTHDGAGLTLSPGDVLRLTLTAGETGGEATASLGTAATGIVLRDDGTEGDVTAGDGVYTRDYTIPPGVEASGAIVTGRFEDPAGNVATRQAEETITIDVPPGAVTLAEAFNVQETSVELSWTRATAVDFDSYRVQRAETADVLADPERVLAATIGSRTTTTVVDDELAEGTTYYYLVEVVDDLGSATASNVISVTTGDEPPAVVSLSTPISVGDTSIILGWTRSPDDDFAAYHLYRAQTASVSDASTLVASITNRNTVQYENQGLVENTRYWYRLYVEDAGGATTASAPRQITTENRAPAPVTLSSVTPAGSDALSLAWTASPAHDFAAYRIYRGETALVDDTDQLVRSISSPTVTSYLDTDLADNTTYHYRIYVADTADSTAASEVVSGTTDNAPPPAVTLSETSSTVVSVSMAWTEAVVDDFDRYLVYRADEDDPGVFALVGTVTRRDQLSYTDFFPEVTSEFLYFYRITVFDTAGSSTESNVISVTITP